MNHSFDVEVAKKVGVNAAIIFNNIEHWYAVNKGNNTNFINGTWWMRMSVAGFKNTYEYMSAKEIRMALDRLFSEGLILITNTNESGYDRTLSYAPSPKGLGVLSICPTGQMDLPDTANGIAPQGKSKLPKGQMIIGEDINKDINKVVSIYTAGENEIKKTISHTDRPLPKTDTDLKNKILFYLNDENDISQEARRAIFEKIARRKISIPGGLTLPETLAELTDWWAGRHFAKNRDLNMNYAGFVAAFKTDLDYYNSVQPDEKKQFPQLQKTGQQKTTGHIIRTQYDENGVPIPRIKTATI